MRAQASIEFLAGFVFLLAISALFIGAVARQKDAFSSSMLLAAEAKRSAMQSLAADELAVFGRHIALSENMAAGPGAGFVQNATWVGGRIAVEVDGHEPI